MRLLKNITRLSLLVACYFMLGCDSRHKRQGINDVLTDSSGNHQLVLERVPSEVLPGQTVGYDFNALVWRVNQDGEWKEKRRVTQNDFQVGINRRRGIVEVHDFDPATGIAIIKVAEADAPPESMRVRFNYSWREWSMLTNAEIKLLRNCSEPFEEY